MGILETVIARVAEGRPADTVLQDIYGRRREFGSRDRRLYSGLVYAFFRWKGWLDQAPALPLERRAAAAWRLDFTESHPALDKLAPLPDPAEPLDSLAAKARQAARWLELPHAPSPDSLLPAAAVPLLENPALVESFQSRPPVWLRVRRSAGPALRALCAGLDMNPVPHPRLPEAWQLPAKAQVADLMARAEGKAEIQDVASQGIGVVAAPQPGSRWWDVCAGAGGKSLHLADLAGGRISILATDLRESILDEAGRRLRLAGYSKQVRLQRQDAARDPLPPGPFDGVLVDAPCSGSGTWGRNPDARWRWNPDSMPGFADTQFAILERTAGAVKPGGVLVYSTCSAMIPENKGVLDRFLAARPDFSLSPFSHPLTGAPTPGFAVLWPWDGPGSCLFVARLVRG
jgi:16S rRNA (cytosine967-C5)-methyltransferase